MFGNKRGMMAQLIGAFVILIIAVAAAPMLIDQIKQVQTYSASYNNSSSMFDMSGAGTTMMTVAIYGCIGLLGVFVIMMIYSALRNGGLVGGGGGVESDDENDEDSDDDVVEEDEESDDDDDEDLDEELDEEDEDEEEEDEDIEDEDEPRKERRHSAVVTTIKKDGKVKTNVKLSPTGYNVDKYEIEKPTDTKLSLKEENFKKTKYD